MKKIIIILFLYITLTIFTLLGLYIFILLVFLKQVSGFSPDIVELNSVIYVLFFVCLGILTLILRKKEKYLLIGTGIYYGIISILLLSFYFFHFRHDLFELQELSDDLFITKYQNIEVKDEENLYTYIGNIMNPEYTGTGLFGKYKQKLNEIYKNESYKAELKEAEKIYNCYLNEEEIQFCDNLPLKKYLETKNFPLVLDEAKIFTDTLKVINKYSIFKTPETPSSYQGITQKLRSHFYYNIENLEKNNTKDVITYFQENYTLFGNMLNGDGGVVQIGNSIISINILNNQLEYIISNYNLSKETLESINKILTNVKNDFDSEKIFANTSKHEYQIATNYMPKYSYDTYIGSNNFIYDYEKTIKILKNIYYFNYIKKDPAISEKIENIYHYNMKKQNMFRYNIIGNLFTAISYISIHGYFEDLEKTKNEINNLILKTQNL